MEYFYKCYDCFEDWVSDHEALICPSCGSTIICLEESKRDDDFEDENLIDARAPTTKVSGSRCCLVM